MPDTIHILRELNVIEPSDLVAPATVWACVGNADEYEDKAVRVAGPVPLVLADRIIEGLETLLERLGYQVVVETTADD